MKKNIVLSILLLCSSVCFSQSYFYDNHYYDRVLLVEAGLSAGVMNCLTDLGGKPGKGKPFFKDINWNCTKLVAGIYANLLYRYAIGLRLEACLGNVHAADSLLKQNSGDALSRYERNCHFRSRIMEMTLLMEFHPLALLADPYEWPSRIAPYLLAGIGLFSFNPQAQYNGEWISLPGLHTEGQGFPTFPGRLPYKTTQFNFPAGLGLCYELSALFNARIEMVYRFLPTDYLDDVSGSYIDQALFYRYLDASRANIAAALADRRPPNSAFSNRRGNPGKKDAYFSFNLKLGVVLNRKRI